MQVYLSESMLKSKTLAAIVANGGKFHVDGAGTLTVELPDGMEPMADVERVFNEHRTAAGLLCDALCITITTGSSSFTACIDGREVYLDTLSKLQSLIVARARTLDAPHHKGRLHAINGNLTVWCTEGETACVQLMPSGSIVSLLRGLGLLPHIQELTRIVAEHCLSTLQHVKSITVYDTSRSSCIRVDFENKALSSLLRNSIEHPCRISLTHFGTAKRSFLAVYAATKDVHLAVMCATGRHTSLEVFNAIANF